MAANCTLDVVFVMDESGSVGKDDYEEMKDFVSELVGKLDIDSGNARAGVVTYSKDVNNDIELNDHSTGASLQSEISKLTHKGGGTWTHVALEFVRTDMLTEVAGDRSEVSNVIVVLTDGASFNKEWTKVCALWRILQKSSLRNNDELMGSTYWIYTVSQKSSHL